MSDDSNAQPGYADALAELESILRRLDDDQIDVDVLGSQVERAAVLIRLCRDRISAARVQVEQIVAELDDDASDATDGSTDDPGPDTGDIT